MNLTDEGWEKWQEGYREYIMAYAKMAEEMHAEIFCIGTEQYSSIDHSIEFWNELIQEVKSIYKGKLVYAANWDAYNKIPFWSQLDYMGIDAYFPIGEKSWKDWANELSNYSEQERKKILFTEFGFISTKDNLKEPWKENINASHCENCQSVAFSIFFETFWEKEWCAGGFVWKWFEKGKSMRYESDKTFLFQGKEAEKIIQKQFAK